MNDCDGSGIVEYTEGGLTHQRPCPGCPACAATEVAEGVEVVEVSAETLETVMTAYAALTGHAEALTLSSEEATALILKHLPALVEMSRLWMLGQDGDPALRTSAHMIRRSGL